PRSAPPKAPLACLVMMICCLPLACCATRSPAPAAATIPTDQAETRDPREAATCLPKGASAMTRGDWDDMEAAAIVGTDQADCAIVKVNISTDEKWVAEIKSVRDERGLLIAYRTPPACTN